MAKTVKVLCDACGHDLTTTSNSVDYRLVVASERKPGYGPGVYTDMMVYPPVDRDYYFCGLRCLDQWRDHERFYDSEFARVEKPWVDEHTTMHPGGIRSCIGPPKELVDQWKAEARQSASKKYPIRASAN